MGVDRTSEFLACFDRATTDSDAKAPLLRQRLRHAKLAVGGGAFQDNRGSTEELGPDMDRHVPPTSFNAEASRLVRLLHFNVKY